MIESKDINYYIEEPSRLLLKKPFTRGGTYKADIHRNVNIASKTPVDFDNLTMTEISQDMFLQEYDPSLHKIRYNMSIPKVAVRVGGNTIDIDDMTVTAAYQKNIHAAHVLHLANKPMVFTLCNINKDKRYTELFQELKQEWEYRNMESVKYDVISKQKKVGDVGLLYRYDKKKKKLITKTYSYDEGYIVIPNYDEYGEQIACSLYYKADDNSKIIDTYDDTYHYRFIESSEEGILNGWEITSEIHGFSRCPLLYKRGKVAWEYAESSIEMWELMANINAVTLKRFGTFGMVITGEMDESSFKTDGSTLVINLQADTKQDAKVLEFPEPKKMIEYLDFLEKSISIFSSVSFITPKDITSTGSGGNGIFLAMKNDLALATQSIADWRDFTNAMVYLFQEGLSLEQNNNKYNDLKISASLEAWSMESDTTKITNLAMQSKWLSTKSIVDASPNAAPDELARIEEQKAEEKKAEKEQALIDNANKAENIAKNNSSEIQSATNKQTTSQKM